MVPRFLPLSMVLFNEEEQDKENRREQEIAVRGWNVHHIEFIYKGLQLVFNIKGHVSDSKVATVTLINIIRGL